MDKFTEQNITDTLEQNYMPYAMSVIVSRAIPEIDGFKPAHRKLLYTMYTMGLLKSKRVKSADVVGQTMRLNPHGDGAIYETLVRLTRGNESLLHPFIDSKGNFGKQTSRDMAYAASRYTEVRLDEICNQLFSNIDKNTVDFMENYNGTTKEPVLFPTTFPNVLVTPNIGIAVGMASSICSFNLKEVCEATKAYIYNNDVDLTEYIKAPDFPSGGQFIKNDDETKKVFETGRGSFKVRAKYRFDKKNSVIEIYEIPYTTTIEFIIDKIVTLVKANKVKEINDVRDETDLNGLKIAIDIKKSADPDMLMNKLFKLTSLEDNFNCNFNILIDGKPNVLGIKQILHHWINFRTQCIKRQTEFDINKKNDYLHLLNGLNKILIDIDKVIKIIRDTKKDRDVIQNLIQGFDIDKIQADYIADIKLRNLNEEYILNKIKEKNNLAKEIQKLKDLLSSDKLLNKYIVKQLDDVSNKYGKERKTEIISNNNIEVINEQDFIEDYQLKIFLTKHNYLKKISLASLRSASNQNLKEDDYIMQELDSTNKSDILLFSSKQNVYKLKNYDIPDCKASSLGEYLANLLDFAPDEDILYIVSTQDYEGNILFAFENGKVAKVPLKSYATKINRRKLINAYSDKSEVVFIDFMELEKDYILIRDTDKALLFSSELVNLKISKDTVGVQVFNLKKDSKVTKAFEISKFISDDTEHYRTNKIPVTGHFLTLKDKANL